MVMKRAPGVEIVLLRKSLTVMRYDVGVLQLPGVIDSVAPNCDEFAVWVRFFWPVANNNASIRYVFPSIFRDVRLVDEENFVGAFYAAWHALCKASKLVFL